MGFTIDMVTGNIGNVTNGINSEKFEFATPTTSSIDNIDWLPFEGLLPVSDTLQAPEDYIIPSTLIDCDIDSFIEGVIR